MNRIALDEPDEVGIIPQPIVFWHHGRRYDAAVSSSAIKPERILAQSGGGYFTLKGDYGRALLADPLSMHLMESLKERHANRSWERQRERQTALKLKGG